MVGTLSKKKQLLGFFVFFIFPSTMPEPGPEVPLSVAQLKDGDGGEVSIPSVWRDDIRASDAETETVEITTKNQR